MRPIFVRSCIVLLTVAGCDPDPPRPAATAEGGGAPASLVQTKGASAKQAKQERATLPDAKQAFLEVMQLIAKRYVDQDLPEDELYSGALEGVLGRLIQIKDRRINTTLSPQWLKEMKVGLKGSFSGVGMVIKNVEGLVMVRQVIAGGPGDRAGVKAGDRLLAVDGTEVRDLEIGAIVALIRGKTGSTAKLYLQRDTREWVLPVVRGPVTVPAVSAALLEKDVAYVRVASFNRQTTTQLDEAVASLTKKGAGRVVLDLRGSPGGLLDVAIEVADRFLPPGARVVSLRRRAGVEEVRSASGKHPGDRLPVVVVVDRHTASGAEIVAASLLDNKRAVAVGEPTLGKGTVEEIFQLKNGWGLKLSIARFFSPAGTSLQGRGVRPDFIIPGAASGPVSHAAPADAETLVRDPQVQAALRVLALGR